MKNHFYQIAIFLLFFVQVNAQEPDENALNLMMDSINKSFQYQSGNIALPGGIATIQVPTGWRYLNEKQSNFVLTDLWGNPPQTTMGMLFPENIGPLDSNSVAFILSFEEMGFVKDDDADSYNYNDILKDLQKETEASNAERVKEGYDAITLVGWAAPPFYDKEKKAIHWAKELQFGPDGQFPRTLNYDVRILGRKGILSMNAVSDIHALEMVKKSIPDLVNSIQYTEGNRYADFDSKVDNVAAWTIGGLVAGKVLAKAGFFAVILKFIKPILLLVGGGGAAAWRWITGRRKEEEEPTLEQNSSDTPA